MDKRSVILVVDDDPEILDLYTRVLTKAGFLVITAADGADGVKMAREKHPDLILMDFRMPVMDGMSAATELRSDPGTRDIKLVFITAFGDPNQNMSEADAKLAKEFGVLDFIEKGLPLKEFVARVNGCLSR